MTQYDSIDREPIWAALFELLQDELGEIFVTMSRKHMGPSNLTPERQPALFLVQGPEVREETPQRTPGKLALNGIIVIYDFDRSADEEPGKETLLLATKINGYLKAIDEALQPDPGEKQTLGGLVEHCWISGETDVDAGVLSKQGFATIPVHILVP